MSDAAVLVLAGVAGAGLGAMFFAGLWWTLRRAMTSAHPALWFAPSLLVRMSATVVGFYLVSAGTWQRLVACLAGFTVARAAVTWLTRPGLGRSQEARHAADT